MKYVLMQVEEGEQILQPRCYKVVNDEIIEVV